MKTIYALKDPQTGNIRYVGATCNLAKRYLLHLHAAPKITTKCAEWVRELKACGMRPVVEVIIPCSMDWQADEQAAISRLRDEGFDLLNQTRGGLGCYDLLPSKTTRQKRSATLKARYAGDIEQMERRREIMRQAARSPAAREAASTRMADIWADPSKAAAMRERMRGSKSRKKESRSC